MTIGSPGQQTLHDSAQSRQRDRSIGTGVHGGANGFQMGDVFRLVIITHKRYERDFMLAGQVTQHVILPHSCAGVQWIRQAPGSDTGHVPRYVPLPKNMISGVCKMIMVSSRGLACLT